MRACLLRNSLIRLVKHAKNAAESDLGEMEAKEDAHDAYFAEYAGENGSGFGVVAEKEDISSLSLSLFFFSPGCFNTVVLQAVRSVLNLLR